MIERTSLIAYALSFTSFLLDSKVGKEIHKIILFGSVPRGDFNEKSDLDLFIDTDEKYEIDIKKNLSLYQSSQTYKLWQLKGIKTEISLKVGKLQEWTLKREVLSSGILLYGKYNELAEKVKYLILLTIDVQKKKNAQQVRIWRALYGYSQKVGKKMYSSKGLIEKTGGKKLGKGIFIIPMEQRQEVLSFLNKNKVNYTLNEIWSDSL